MRVILLHAHGAAGVVGLELESAASGWYTLEVARTTKIVRKEPPR